MSKLYPPYINGTIPAFYKAYDAQNIAESDGTVIIVPFTMNNSVGISSISGFVLRIKTVQSGVYLCPPIYSTDVDPEKYEVRFQIPKQYTALMNEGQFYKLQVAYYKGPQEESSVGYYSTVGVTKCVSKPVVSINGFDSSSINLFSNEYLGIYDVSEGRDQSEKVYSYQFDFYDEDDKLVYTTGEVIHNSSNDYDYNYSTDNITVNDFAQDNRTYTVQYTITTINGLVMSTPRYKLTTEKFVTPAKNITIIPKMNFNNGYMTVNFQGVMDTIVTDEVIDTEWQEVNGKWEKVNIYKTEEKEQTYYGEYLITRACSDDNYSVWSELFRFRLDNEKPSTISLRDFTVQQGYKYKYALQQYNIFGIYSSRITTAEVEADFEDAFLFDGERHLKIRFNAQMNSFKTQVQEAKIDTIGSQYPFIFRNSKGYYKTFPIGGLLSYQMDEEELFLPHKQSERTRELTLIRKEESKFDSELDKEKLLEMREGIALEESAIHGNDTDPSAKNFFKERVFKLAVLDWLNDGQPKLFKSPSEGNYIVRLMNTSLKPEKQLGRMIHNFSTTAYEVAEATYENLLKFGFLQLQEPSDYVPLFRTFDLEKDKTNGTIEINFDESLISFTCENMRPGDYVIVHYKGGSQQAIRIGVTGSFNFQNEGGQIITKLSFPSLGLKQIGQVTCYFRTTRLTEFDAVTNIRLVTYTNKQFVGTDPSLITVEDTISSTKNKILNQEYKALQKTNMRDWLNQGVVQESGGYKVLTDKCAEQIRDYVPGDIAQQINTTIYDGQVDKISLLNLEQAHFHLRELIPVYSYSEQPQDCGAITGKRPEKYSTTPFGRPYPINELKVHELQDPFCMYETFEWVPAGTYLISNKWDKDATYYMKKGNEYVIMDGVDNAEEGMIRNGKIKTQAGYNLMISNTRFETPYVLSTGEWTQPVYFASADSTCAYYDAYYDVWATEYDTTFYINDRYQFVPLKWSQTNENGLSEWVSLIYNKKIIDDGGNQVIKYFYDYQGEPVEWRYEDMYLRNEDGEYVKAEASGFMGVPNATMYLRIANEIDLSIIKDKSLYNLGKVSAMKIGNGVMMEGTFQLKVIDYYTEMSNAAVIEAKEKYLSRSALLKRILSVYEVIENADKAWQKYHALKNLYSIILTGSTENDDGQEVFKLIDLDIERVKAFLEDEQEYPFLEIMDDLELEHINTVLELQDDEKIDGIQLKLAQLQYVVADLIVQLDQLQAEIFEERTLFMGMMSQLNIYAQERNSMTTHHRAYRILLRMAEEIKEKNEAESHMLLWTNVNAHYRWAMEQLLDLTSYDENLGLVYSSNVTAAQEKIAALLKQQEVYQQIQNERNDDIELDEYIEDYIAQLYTEIIFYEDQKIRFADYYNNLSDEQKESAGTKQLNIDTLFSTNSFDDNLYFMLAVQKIEETTDKLYNLYDQYAQIDIDSVETEKAAIDFLVYFKNYYTPLSNLATMYRRPLPIYIDKEYLKEFSQVYSQLSIAGRAKYIEQLRYLNEVAFTAEVSEALFCEGYQSTVDWDAAYSDEHREEALEVITLMADFVQNSLDYWNTYQPGGYLYNPGDGSTQPNLDWIIFTLQNRFVYNLYSAKEVYLKQQKFARSLDAFNNYIVERGSGLIEDWIANGEESEAYQLIQEYDKIFGTAFAKQEPLLQNFLLPSDQEIKLIIRDGFDLAQVETWTNTAADFNIAEPIDLDTTELPYDVRKYNINQRLTQFYGTTQKDSETGVEKEYGLIYWYINREIRSKYELLEKQYAQAVALQTDYERRINNYTTKYLKYLEEYNSNYATYIGYKTNDPECMDFYLSKYSKLEYSESLIRRDITYYKDNTGTVATPQGIEKFFSGKGGELYVYKDSRSEKMDNLREEVLQAWINFVNILDIEYTKDRERGLYVV